MSEISILSDNYPLLIQHFDLSETVNDDNILLDKSYKKNNSLTVSSPPVIEYDEELKRNVSVFDGEKSYIPIGKAGKVTDTITINVLAYIDDWKNNQGRMISCTQAGGWNFFNDESYSFYIHINNVYTIYSYQQAAMLNGWNMITMSFDGFCVKYYINGTLINSIKISDTKQQLTYNSTNGIMIGAESYMGDEFSVEDNRATNKSFFKGKIADVRIYNEALTYNNVKKIFKSFNVTRKIGQQLLIPDGNWQRIDDDDKCIQYDNTFSIYKNDENYNGTEHASNTINSCINFKFYGTKIRLINYQYSNRSNDIDVYIDDIKYGKSIQYGDIASYIISFQKLELAKKPHKVKIINNTSNYMSLDAIDIDEDGYPMTEEEYNQYLKEKEYENNSISINKTLKANLPKKSTKNIEIHFTEDGEMYINKEDGAFIKVGSESIYTDEEVNTTIDNILNSYDGTTDSTVYTDEEVDNAVTSIINKY